MVYVIVIVRRTCFWIGSRCFVGRRDFSNGSGFERSLWWVCSFGSFLRPPSPACAIIVSYFFFNFNFLLSGPSVGNSSACVNGSIYYYVPVIDLKKPSEKAYVLGGNCCRYPKKQKKNTTTSADEERALLCLLGICAIRARRVLVLKGRGLSKVTMKSPPPQRKERKERKERERKRKEKAACLNDRDLLHVKTRKR